MRTVLMSLNGQLRPVQVRDRSVDTDVKARREGRHSNEPGHVAAPFAGVVTLQVAEGDQVAAGRHRRDDRGHEDGGRRSPPRRAGTVERAGDRRRSSRSRAVTSWWSSRDAADRRRRRRPADRRPADRHAAHVRPGARGPVLDARGARGARGRRGPRPLRGLRRAGDRGALARGVHRGPRRARPAGLRGDQPATWASPACRARSCGAARCSRYLRRSPGPVDLVFVDPPYADAVDDIVALLPRWTRTDAVVVVERDGRSPAPTWPEGLEPEEPRVYGETTLHVATRT